MKRKQEFKDAQPKQVVIKDSRFGIRRLFLNPQERPSIGQYTNPGRAWHGTR